MVGFVLWVPVKTGEAEQGNPDMPQGKPGRGWSTYSGFPEARPNRPQCAPGKAKLLGGAWAFGGHTCHEAGHISSW